MQNAICNAKIQNRTANIQHKTHLHLGISVLAGKAVAIRIIMNSSTRSIKTQHTKHKTKESNGNVQHSQRNLARR